MAATVTSQAFLKQPKLLSFSPKTLQNPHSNLICVPSSTNSQLRFGLKLGNGFAAKASMAIVETDSKPRVSEKRANNPIIVIDNYDSFTYNLCQCIGEAFGGKIVRSPYGVMHGKSSPVYYNEEEDNLFAGLSNPFTAGRYHSLVIEKDSFPSEELEITAWTEDGLIMAARYKKYRHLQGVQFHPESIITSEGRTIVRNFIKLIKKSESESEN